MGRDGFQFPSLSERTRARMQRHGLAVLTAQQAIMASAAGSILRHTLAGAGRHQAMRHYPEGDRIDRVTGAQYFYHAHRENFATEEHGHFHCFLRRHAVPARARPLAAAGGESGAAMTHLVAIAMDRHSRPIRLFTVNRWVTDDTWYAARHHPGLVRRFAFERARDPHWAPLDRWVAGMLQLFAPQIAWLALARDRAIARWQAEHPGEDPYAARALEELSELPIDLERQIRRLTA
jgi:hypothetical protein